jgi:hypothetical protein
MLCGMTSWRAQRGRENKGRGKGGPTSKRGRVLQGDAGEVVPISHNP